MVLKATVAAARDPADLAPTGNRAAIMLAPLPVGEPDPARRLAQIARATSARKCYPPYQPAGRFAQRAMIRAMPRQRLANLFTSNLPGPPKPLYLAGARVLYLFQIGVVQGNIYHSPQRPHGLGFRASAMTFASTRDRKRRVDWKKGAQPAVWEEGP